MNRANKPEGFSDQQAPTEKVPDDPESSDQSPTKREAKTKIETEDFGQDRYLNQLSDLAQQSNRQTLSKKEQKARLAKLIPDDKEITQLIQLSELSYDEVYEYLKEQIPDTELDAIDKTKLLKTAKSWHYRAKARVNYLAMKYYTEQNPDFEFDEKDLLDKNGNPLRGAALTAKKASLIRKEAFLTPSETAAEKPDKRETASLPKFTEILKQQARERTKQAEQSIESSLEEIDNKEIEADPGKIINRFSKYLKNSPRMGGLAKATAIAMLLGSIVWGGMRIKDKYLRPSEVQAMSDPAAVRELSRQELEELGILQPQTKTPTTEPSPTQTTPPTKTAPPTNAKIERPPTSEFTPVSEPSETLATPTTKTTETTESPQTPEQQEAPIILKQLYQSVIEQREKRQTREAQKTTKELGPFTPWEQRINPELNKNRINLLILGSDARPGETIARADAPIVVSYNIETNQVDLLRIPRDVFAPEVDDLSENYRGKYFRVNAGTVFGDQEEARLIFEQATGLSQDFVFGVRFEAVTQAINSIGGIEVKFTESFVARYRDDKKFKKLGVEMTPGPKTLNGEQALWYARVRKKDTDYHRGERQQQVMEALLQKLAAQARENPLDLLKLLGTVNSLRAEGSLQFTSEIGLTELSSLLKSIVLNSEARSSLQNLQRPAINKLNPWGDLIRSADVEGDPYLTAVGPVPNTETPEANFAYWKNLREFLKKNLIPIPVETSEETPR